MMFKLLFGILSTVLALVAFVPYLRDIFARRTRPHSYSWLVWSLLQATAAFASLSHGGGYGALGIATGGAVSLSVFLLSFRYGTKNITPFDTFCLVGVLIAIAVWFFAKDPLVSVILITGIDFVGFLPTYRKGYEEPYSETMSLYVLSSVSNASAVLAIGTYSTVTTLYAASLVLTNGICVLLLLLGRRRVASVGVH